MKTTRKNQRLIYDVGMHKGEDTYFYLKKGFSVVAFEAHPDLIASCNKRFAAEVADGRLVIVEGAIVDPLEHPSGEVTFYENLGSSVWGTVSTDWVKRNERLGKKSRPIVVKAVSFAQCLERYGIPRYLKIDIEGADRLCLNALLEFAERPDFVSIECEKVHFDDLVEDVNTFQRLGYSSFKIVNQASVHRLREPPQGEGKRVGHKFEKGSSGLFGMDLPGAWLTKAEILSRFKRIFFFYRLFGDDGTWKAMPWWIGYAAILLLSNKTIPGWHDLHARHASSD